MVSRKRRDGGDQVGAMARCVSQDRQPHVLLGSHRQVQGRLTHNRAEDDRTRETRRICC